MIKALIIVGAIALALGILYVAICFIKFILEELNHSFKNAKREIKKLLEEIEWKSTH